MIKGGIYINKINMNKLLNTFENFFYFTFMLVIVIVSVLYITGNSVTSIKFVNKFIFFFYCLLLIFVLYKSVLVFFKVFYEIKIVKRKKELGEIIAKQKSAKAIVPERDEDSSLENLKKESEVEKEMLNEIPHHEVQNNIDLNETKEKLIIERNFEEKNKKIDIASIRFDDVNEMYKYLKKIETEIKEHQEEEQKRRLNLTIEYTILFFTLAGSRDYDVAKACKVVEFFIKTGNVKIIKDLHIPKNKKLRNAELKQFVTNIINYNEKKYLNSNLFLKIIFGEWFTGEIKNISHNTSNLPKDSLVSKDGLEADLVRFRKMIQIKDKNNPI